MQNNRVWQRGCGLKRTVVEGVRSDSRRNTHLHIETLQLSSKVLQRSPEVAALMGG